VPGRELLHVFSLGRVRADAVAEVEERVARAEEVALVAAARPGADFTKLRYGRKLFEYLCYLQVLTNIHQKIYIYFGYYKKP
jgi:hypothetical protein